MDGTNNSRGMTTHQVEVNVYYQNHVERIKINICDLGRTEVILGMPWLAAHNPEINWEIREVKMTRCPLLCGRNSKIKEKKEAKRGRQVTVSEKEKIVRWAANKKENWGREEEVEVDYRKIKEMVPKKFLK